MGVENNYSPAEEYERRLLRLEEQVGELQDEYHGVDKKLDVFQASITGSLKALEGLPEAMNQMTNTMIAMRGTMEDNGKKTDSLSEQVSELSDKVNEIDNRDKFSISDWIKKNWITITLAVALAGYFVSDKITKMF